MGWEVNRKVDLIDNTFGLSGSGKLPVRLTYQILLLCTMVGLEGNCWWNLPSPKPSFLPYKCPKTHICISHVFCIHSHTKALVLQLPWLKNNSTPVEVGLSFLSLSPSHLHQSQFYTHNFQWYGSLCLSPFLETHNN